MTTSSAFDLDAFGRRHIGTTPSDHALMLAAARLRLPRRAHGGRGADRRSAWARCSNSAIPAAATEREALAELRALAEQNTVRTSMIGLGYYGTITPAVIQRNVLENPSWYTAYTPYQPEISQGRLEALINFQTMVTDLTGLDTANASMLDEGTAVVEGMLLARRASKSAVEPLRRRRRRAAADAGAARVPRRGRRHRARRRRPRRGHGCRRPRRALRRLRAVPGRIGPRLEPGIRHRRVEGAGRPRRRRRRPARAHADHEPGRARRRRRRRHHPALRRADGLRRSARRLHGRARGPRAPAARPPRRRLAGRRRPPRLPAQPAGARAAHPPREGDVEHLHRAGAARRHGVDVRGLPRAPRHPAHRRSRPPAKAKALADALTGLGLTLAHDAYFDTLRVHVPGLAKNVVARGARARPATCGRPTRRPCTSRSTRPPPTDELSLVVEAFGFGERAEMRGLDCPRCPRAVPGRPAPHERVPRAPGVQHAPLRDADDALPQAPRRPRLRARPRHDPARLVHDEAQRGHRDGGRHLARVREPPPVRARGRRRRARSGSSSSSRPGSPRSPATTPCRCSRTPAARASSPGLLAIRGYHLANGDAERDRLPHPVERARHERGVRGARRHARRRRRLRRARQRRPRRPAREDRRARRPHRGADDHLPVDARRLRARGARRSRRPCTTPAARSTSTAPTSTRCSASPGSATSAATSRT